MNDAPTPIAKFIENKKILEENNYSILKEKQNYILTCSRTNYDSIIFSIKLDAEFISLYYESEYEFKNLCQISSLFKVAKTSDKAYKILIKNIVDYKKDMTIEFIPNCLMLTMKFMLPYEEIESGKIKLEKKNIDLDIILQKFNNKLNDIQENQTKIEKKLSEKLNLVKSEQNLVNDEINKNIENIKLFNSKIEELNNKNANIIKEIGEQQKIYNDNIKKFEKQIENNINKQLNNENEITEIKANFLEKRNVDKNLFESINKKLNFIESNQSKMKEFINNNNNEFIKINEQISNYQKSLEKSNEDIDLIEKKQKILKNNFNDNILEINSIKIIQSKLEKNEEERDKNIKESLNKALKDIEFLKDKINQNEKSINIFMEKIKELEEEKRNKLEEEEKKRKLEEEKKKKLKEEEKFKEIGIQKKTILQKNLKLPKPELRIKSKKLNIPPKIRTPLSDSYFALNEKYRTSNTDSKDDKYKEIIKEENNESNFNKIDIKNSDKRLERNFTETNFFKPPHKFSLYKTISSKLFNKYSRNNRACIFSQINDKRDHIYIAFGDISFSLKCYDYCCEREFTIIENLHKNIFDSVRHFYDNKKFRDLIITSSLDNHVKVVDFKRLKSSIILDLSLEWCKEAIINTVYFIEDKIMIPFAYYNKKGNISFYDLNEKKVGEFKDDPGYVLCINCYYAEKMKTNLAIISNLEGIYVYIINNYSLYNKFEPKLMLKSKRFAEGIIFENEEKLILLGPLFSHGFIFLWDLISKELIYSIKLSHGITDICLWSNNYLFASLNDSIRDKFVLINLNEKCIEKGFDDIKDRCCFGIHILRSKREGGFLITFTSAGKLYLYTL